MLRELKFVQGAVASKDYVPSLQHFRIADGRIEGFNGQLRLSTPTDLQITAMPKAVSFARAIEQLPPDREVALNLTQAGRLSVKAGNFKAFVECLKDADAFPTVVPAGDILPMPGGILPVLRKLAPFMGIDASRQWAMGILLTGQSAFVTNNVVLLEHWLPVVFPPGINLPSGTVKEMLRVNAEPVSMQIEAAAITFHYDNGAWMRSSLNAVDWPDVSRVLDREANMRPLPDGFFDAVNRLEKLVEKTRRLYLRGGTISTMDSDDAGAMIDLDDFGGKGCFYRDQVALLDGVVTEIDFSLYPSPLLFYGDMLRGAITGIRV